jgi:tetratricopeptide (TPR) repeat protein
MHAKEIKLTITIFTLCLNSLLVSWPASAGPALKAKPASPKLEQKQEAEAEAIEHPAAWSDAIPYYNLANKYLEKERYEDAVDNYHEAIARFPDDPDFYINLGYCYRKLEDFESAEQAFRKALTLNNKDWVTWSNLANALLKQNKLPETVSTFEKCLKLTMPASERALINRDIADIKKILAMRQPKSAPKPEIVPGKGSLKGSFKESLKESAKATPSPALQTTAKKPITPSSKVEPVKAQPKEKGESSGWDYVYK